MPRSPSRSRLGAVTVLASMSLLATACGGAEEEGSSAPRSGVLSGVCPSKVVIQTDWDPEAEHGGVYALLGDKYTADIRRRSVSGPLMAKGIDTGVDVEIRIGGSSIGYQGAESMLYQDKDIMFGYGRVSEYMGALKKTPVVSVMATLEKSPYAIYWDPKTYPQAKTIADLKAQNVTILMGTGSEVWQDYFVKTGVIDKSQMDRSNASKPGTFVAAGGKDAELGLITAEPYTYKHLPSWGRDVKAQLIHDTGFPDYFQTLLVRKKDVTEKAACLSKLVPIMQQAEVDYVKGATRTNDLILELVDDYKTNWTYTAEQAKASDDAQVSQGLVGNGHDRTLGNFDMARVKTLIQIVAKYSDADVAGITPDDLVTNKFIDTSIGLN